MVLVADSGSTKCTWAWKSPEGEVRKVMTSGMNPYFRDMGSIRSEVQEIVMPQTGTEVSRIFFYGSGIVNQAQSEIVSSALSGIFPIAEIELFSDVMAASRALFGDRAGIACILGTGSNACLYNGHSITAGISPLGFILGDEGSGAVMGRHLLGDYFKEVMPGSVRRKFEDRFKVSRDEVLSRVYRQERPNQYLATFTRFLSEEAGEAYCHDFVTRNLTGFFERNVIKLPGYAQYPIGFVGSVAYHFREILIGICKEYHLECQEILQEPIDGLIKFHS